MPYYHVIIGLKSRPHRGAIEENLLEPDLFNNIVKPYNNGKPFKCGDCVVSQDDILSIKITTSEQYLSFPTFFVSPESCFAYHWQVINQEEDVTDSYIKMLPQRKKETIKETMRISKNVFIVHGRDHNPMKELKTMLREFGLNPIVLHEQPSGSRTIVEKLEKYSDVGYAFVILTPDDIGISSHDLDIEKLRKGRIGRKLAGSIDYMLSQMRTRARQNVVLEFGYFIGLLNRDKVCCLYKGDIELPSDMHGIVYIPFRESVNEVKDMIIKELKAADYEITI